MHFFYLRYIVIYPLDPLPKNYFSKRSYCEGRKAFPMRNPKPIRKLSSSEDINPPSFVTFSISTQILTKYY